MQRTAQRENAFHATIRPNSNSDSSTLRGDTRCDDETMPRGDRRTPFGFFGAGSAADLATIDGVETLKNY